MSDRILDLKVAGVTQRNQVVGTIGCFPRSERGTRLQVMNVERIADVALMAFAPLTGVAVAFAYRLCKELPAATLSKLSSFIGSVVRMVLAAPMCPVAAIGTEGAATGDAGSERPEFLSALSASKLDGSFLAAVSTGQRAASNVGGHRMEGLSTNSAISYASFRLSERLMAVGRAEYSGASLLMVRARELLAAPTAGVGLSKNLRGKLAGATAVDGGASVGLKLASALRAGLNHG